MIRFVVAQNQAEMVRLDAVIMLYVFNSTIRARVEHDKSFILAEYSSHDLALFTFGELQERINCCTAAVYHLPSEKAAVKTQEYFKKNKSYGNK